MPRFSKRELLGVGAAAGLMTNVDEALAHDGVPEMASNAEIFRTIVDLWRMGERSPYRYRMPGTPEDHRAARYIARRFRRAGLQDVQVERSPIPVAFPEQWKLSVESVHGMEDVPCYFLRYAKFTPQEGIAGDLLYVGRGEEKDLDALGLTDLRGKIVLVDIAAGTLPYAKALSRSLFYTDAQNTIEDLPYSIGLPLLNFPSALIAAANRGAAGFIGILTFRADGINEEYHGLKEFNPLLTGLTVDPVAGARLRALAAERGSRARLTLTERRDLPSGEGHTYNLYGVIPGQTDETIVVMSHHDGGATNEGSGAAVVIALAEYYARLPAESRRKTLVFFLIGSHFGLRYDLAIQAPRLIGMRDRIACILNMEMVARHYSFRDGAYFRENLVSPQMFNITRGAPVLLDAVRAAIIRQGLDRAIVTPQVAGEGAHMAQFGLGPIVERIALNAPQFSHADTPETVMETALRPNACVFADVIDTLDPVPLAELQKLNVPLTGADFQAGETRAHDTVARRP